MEKRLLLTLCLCVGLLSGNTHASTNIFKKKKPVKTEVAATPPPKPPTSDSDIKPYKDVITKAAVTSRGFFKVHKVKDKYYFELPDSILGRDLLVVNRISKSPVSRNKQLTGYPGDQIAENVVRFEKGGDNKVFLRDISYIEQANDEDNLSLLVQNSNIQPILESFPIVTFAEDSVAKTRYAVIEVTKFINSDNSVISFDARVKKSRGIGSIFADRGYVDTVKAFPLNVEIRTVKTFAQTPPQNASPAANANFVSEPMTYELNSSIILLPKEPMKARFFDPRVGYFAVRYTDFDANPQGIEYKSKITRWRLEPKPEDLAKYRAGELVEPQKPIIIYVDPATPKKWVPYLLAGINDWKKAFEKAGFKNAIIGLEAPNDSTWSIEDARHSVLVYKASDIPNASGPHVHDPRSGEILETHINWYHNVMLLLHNWYQIQAGPIDPQARTANFDDELMGQLVRFVSSHEVGHTLGLRHNFGSSATVPVENLRNKAWVEANGHTPSIMDYARFNYVAQPEDNIGRAGIFPRIGIYDEWAIEWGYRLFPQFETPEAEVSFQNKLIMAKLQSDVRYTFGTEIDPDDPRNQSEDLGDNSMLASQYGIKNLKRIVPQILTWTREPDKSYEKANVLYNEVATQFNRYALHVAKNVAGVNSTPLTVEQSGNQREFIPAQKQKEAVLFLNEYVFATPEWLIDKALIEKAEVEPVTIIGAIQRNVLSRLISRSTIEKMLRNEAYNAKDAYTADNFFKDLKKGVWSETSKLDIYRRNLQKNYVNALISLIQPLPGAAMPAPSPAPSDAVGIARTQLMDLLPEIKHLAASSSGVKRSHYIDLQAKITQALDPK
ncbi:glutaminyl-tRNA synthetase [Bacteroidia bacterium]|nr:glutaminyl-tRNA synthetase [Bacteroidia bacterium]